MKKIRITEKCSQCGICAAKCPEFFREDESGNVCLISENVSETAELLSTVEACPVKAIELGANVDEKAVLQSYIAELEKMKSGITVTKKDIEFDESYTRKVFMPRAGMSGYNYKSSSQAERAGYEAFVDNSYSQIDNVILERITDYRVTTIKPYYSKDSESIYVKNNQKVADILKSVSAVSGFENMPSDFTDVDAFPDERDTIWKMLNKGEIISDNFIGIVRREFSCSASDYKLYIDWDDTEDYRGKDIYNYNANEASDELGNDIRDALKYAKSDVEDAALDYVKGLVDSYNKKLKSVIEEKLKLVNCKMN